MSLNKVKRKKEKARLNIAINKEILEEAKACNINISATIEKNLAYFIDLDKKVSESSERLDHIRDMYNDTFMKIRELLELQEVEEIEIGEFENSKRSRLIIQDEVDSYAREGIDFPLPEVIGAKLILRQNTLLYLKDGKYYIDKDIRDIRHDTPGRNPIRNCHLRFLYSPQVIYRNLISKIIEKQKGDEEKVKKLRLGLKILDTVLRDDKQDSSESGLETPLFRRIESSGIEVTHDTNSVSTAGAEGEEIVTV